MAQNRQCVELMASGDLTLPTMAAEMGIVSSVSSCSHHTHYKCTCQYVMFMCLQLTVELPSLLPVVS